MRETAHVSNITPLVLRRQLPPAPASISEGEPAASSYNSELTWLVQLNIFEEQSRMILGQTKGRGSPDGR
jgi:hypothetical protein